MPANIVDGVKHGDISLPQKDYSKLQLKDNIIIGPKPDSGNFFTNLIHKIENSKPVQFIENKVHSVEDFVGDKVHSTEEFIKDIPHKVEQGIHVIADDAKKGLDYVGNTVKSGISDVTNEAEKVALDGALLVGGVILGAIVIMKLL